MEKLKNFNIRLICRYRTRYGEKIEKEAIFAITTKSRIVAEKIAIEKATKQLKEFSYIIASSITVEKKKRSSGIRDGR